MKHLGATQIIIGLFTGTPVAGGLQWTGTYFQGYNGSSWTTFVDMSVANMLRRRSWMGF